MQRVKPIERHNADARAVPLLDAVESALGGTPNMFLTFAQSPPVLDGYLKLGGALRDGGLPAVVGEQIALVAAEENGCNYCASAHTVLGARAGLTSAQIDAAREGTASEALAAGAVRLAKRIIETRGHLADGDLEAARAAGLDDGTIAEVVAHVALNVLSNYFNNVVQTEIDFPHVRPTKSVETATAGSRAI